MTGLRKGAKTRQAERPPASEKSDRRQDSDGNAYVSDEQNESQGETRSANGGRSELPRFESLFNHVEKCKFMLRFSNA